MPAVRDAITQLLAGTPGSEVKESLRRLPPSKQHPAGSIRTLSSLNAVMSDARCSIYNTYKPMVDDTILREYTSPRLATVNARLADQIRSFLDAPLREKERIQREHAADPTWPAAAENCLREMQLLPASLDTFKLTKAEDEELKRFQTRSLLIKNETLLTVDGTALLAHAAAVLERASDKDALNKLLAALLLVSGRRTCEITNGNSIFSEAGTQMYAYYEGQAKKRGSGSRYLIPLLVPFQTFTAALAIFRAKQGDVSLLTNKQIKTRYQASLGRALKNGILPIVCKPHDLRSIYVSLVYTAFESPFTLQRTAMVICGHSRLGESLAYGNVRLVNAEPFRGKYGALEIASTRAHLEESETEDEGEEGEEGEIVTNEYDTRCGTEILACDTEQCAPYAIDETETHPPYTMLVPLTRKRPRGRPPKGMVWDSDLGYYVKKRA